MASPPDSTTGLPQVPDRPGPVEWGGGSLFAQDFLNGPLESSEAWQALTAAELEAVGATLREVVERFPRQHEPSEATTEDELIWPVLRGLGWRDVLRQQRLSSHGRVVGQFEIFGARTAMQRPRPTHGGGSARL